MASLEMARQGAVDALALDLQAGYNDQQLTLAGKIGLIHLLLSHERFPIELAGKFSNAAVKIDGAIGDVFRLRGIDLQARSLRKLQHSRYNRNLRAFSDR